MRDARRGEIQPDHRDGEQEHRDDVGGRRYYRGEHDDQEHRDPPGIQNRFGAQHPDEVEQDQEDRQDERDSDGNDQLQDEVEIVLGAWMNAVSSLGAKLVRS